uniref:RING-type domain-containing protein n=1 Tax=Steinernema glaseri TaxID=37863 RepID=A0A1I7Z7M6_9BILA
MFVSAPRLEMPPVSDKTVSTIPLAPPLTVCFAKCHSAKRPLCGYASRPTVVMNPSPAVARALSNFNYFKMGCSRLVFWSTGYRVDCSSISLSKKRATQRNPTMSSDDQSERQCPLCMETLELDDLNFFPCKCEYQICWFCWHRIRTDENGLCPACRQPYSEEPANFQAVSSAEILKNKNDKRSKAQSKTKKMSTEAKKHLAAYRVLQKNLLYVVGLSARFPEMESNRRLNFFSRFGKIIKMATCLPVNASAYSVYVTYEKDEEALRAIQALHNMVIDGRTVKASLGTTKYCSSFLRNAVCQKIDCMYLHEIADLEVSFTKEDMHAGKHAEYEKRLLEDYEKGKKCLTPAPAVPVPPSTSVDRKSNDTSSVPNTAFPPVIGNSKAGTRSPSLTNTNRKSNSPKVHAGRDHNGVRSEQDQEVATIMDQSLPDSPTAEAQKCLQEEDRKNDKSEKSVKSEEAKLNGYTRSTSTSPSTCNGIAKQETRTDASGAGAKSAQPAPEAADGVNMKQMVINRVENDELTEDVVVERTTCRSPPGFSRRDTPPTEADVNERDEVPQKPNDIPPPPGLSAPPAESSILSMLQKRMENQHISAKPSGVSSNWQDMFGFRTTESQEARVNDDELGFDPFQESAKALAALVAQESNKDRTGHKQVVDEARLDRHHQRVHHRSVAPPPGFANGSEEDRSKWSFASNDNLYPSFGHNRQQQQRGERCFPENSLLATIFSSAQNGNLQARANIPGNQTVGDRLKQQSQVGLFDEGNNGYRQHNQARYPEESFSHHHHAVYSNEALENRRRLQEQANFSAEERMRQHQMMNFASYNGRNCAAPPPGLETARQPLMWPGSRIPTNHQFQDVLGNNEKMFRCEKTDPARIADSQAGLRALLPNVNVRFLETSDDTPLARYHNVFDHQERPTQYSSAASSAHNPFAHQTNTNSYGRSSPSMDSGANQYYYAGQSGNNQWLPPPPGFPPIPRQ